MSATLVTASWSALYAASKLGPLPVQPVRVSRSGPRFWPGTFPAVKELIPPFSMLNNPGDPGNEAAYRLQLDGHGVQRLSERFDAIAAEHGGLPLALACFEKDGTCHRWWVAAWWQEHTGTQVPEIFT